MGKPIPSISSGKILQVFKNNPTAGNGVLVQGDDGRLYKYIHMKNSPTFSVGQKIKAGQQLGLIGSTGRSTGPHLDLQIMENGKHIDPVALLKKLQGGTFKKPANEGKLKDLYEQGVKGQPSGGGGGSSYTNTWKTQKEAKKSAGYKTYKSNLIEAVNAGGVPPSAAVALTELIGRESSWNHKVKNKKSSASGYGQFVNKTKLDFKRKYPQLDYSKPRDQIILTYLYVKERYGTPEAALSAWDKKGWY